MRTTQLRRYELVPDYFDDFVDWFQRDLIPAREAHGFSIDFAVADRDGHEFVWATSIEGDAAQFAEAERVYMESPERAAAFAGAPQRVAVYHLSFVDRLA